MRWIVHPFLVALALLAGMFSSSAQPPSNRDIFADSLERWIELGRHERLAQARALKTARLAPFETDGCSGGLSAGWQILSSALPEFSARHGEQPPWQSCCISHDRAYHAGGRRDDDALTSFEARRRADQELRQCVIRLGKKRMPTLMKTYGMSKNQASSLYREIANVMYRAVRLGGTPCTGLPWRWGFGWPHCE